MPIAEEDFHQECFELFRDGESTTSMINITQSKVLESLGRFKNYKEVEKNVKKIRSALEKEYKESDFYKKTKKPLKEVLFESRFHYFFMLEGVEKRIQEVINSLNLEKIESLMNDMSSMFEQENGEILKAANTFKDLQDK